MRHSEEERPLRTELGRAGLEHVGETAGPATDMKCSACPTKIADIFSGTCAASAIVSLVLPPSAASSRLHAADARRVRQALRAWR